MQDTNQKKTIGEELYLVDLRRRSGTEPKEEDYDRTESPNRKRAHSVGEELWEVHLKRSKGIAPDLDGDEEQEGYKKMKAAGVTPPQECKYNLRSKDEGKKTATQ